MSLNLISFLLFCFMISFGHAIPLLPRWIPFQSFPASGNSGWGWGQATPTSQNTLKLISQPSEPISTNGRKIKNSPFRTPSRNIHIAWAKATSSLINNPRVEVIPNSVGSQNQEDEAGGGGWWSFHNEPLSQPDERTNVPSLQSYPINSPNADEWEK